MSKKDTLAILLPYAFKRALSSYSNEVVLVFKSTSLAYTITLMEVMGYSQLLYGRTYDVMVFGAAGVIYLIVNGLLTLMMRLIERKALAFEHGIKSVFMSDGATLIMLRFIFRCTLSGEYA